MNHIERRYTLEALLMASAIIVWTVPASMLIRVALFGWGRIYG